MKGRCSTNLFVAKCQQLHRAWLDKKKEGEEVHARDKIMRFSRPWIHRWKTLYRVSLRNPNKRIALPRDVRERRILDALKNIYRIRYYFKEKHNVDIPILSGEQMPLHRLESAGEKNALIYRPGYYLQGKLHAFKGESYCFY